MNSVTSTPAGHDVGKNEGRPAPASPLLCHTGVTRHRPPPARMVAMTLKVLSLERVTAQALHVVTCPFTQAWAAGIGRGSVSTTTFSCDCLNVNRF